MTKSLRLIAPGKINWTLEVLRIRPDGYHELRSVMQTIDLHDVVTLTATDDGAITLEITGDAGMLADNPPETNLAYRAAVALRDRAGVSRDVARASCWRSTCRWRRASAAAAATRRRCCAGSTCCGTPGSRTRTSSRSPARSAPTRRSSSSAGRRW